MTDDRPRTSCCGALDLGGSYQGGRPYQCVHEYERSILDHLEPPGEPRTTDFVQMDLGLVSDEMARSQVIVV